MPSDYPELLIYIPCWEDFELAAEQAKTITEQVDNLKAKSQQIHFKVHITISVNGVTLSDSSRNRILNYADELISYEAGIGGDVNINQGFLKALERESEYCWLLSANDPVSPQIMELINSAFLEHPGVELLTFYTRDKKETLHIENVFDEQLKDFTFGLISCNIYSAKAFGDSFNLGPKLGWTGWGQLAVLQDACNARGLIHTIAIPTPHGFVPRPGGSDNSQSETDRIRRGYRHSFFGMPILLFIIFSKDKHGRDIAIRNWLRDSWFMFNFYRVKDRKIDSSFQKGAVDPLWIQDISLQILKQQGITARAMIFFGSHIKWESLKNNNIAKQVRNLFS